MNQHLRRTPTRLADGRELVYFDDSPAYVAGELTRRLDDPRPLGDRFAAVTGPDGHEHPYTGPEMRLDPLSGDWIPMAAHRMNRTFLPAADSCPLCPARPGAAYSDGEVPDTDYDVVVFENRFPSLQLVPGVSDVDGALEGEGTLETRAPASGRCEVIVFSSDHSSSFGALPPQRVRTIIDAWADRTEALGREPGVEQVFCFENRGQEIGVTLHHPHGQIYGYPYLTPKTRAMLAQARAHHERTGGNLLRDVLDAELADGRRIVLQTEHWVAYVPFAARWPVEVHVAPRRDVPDLPALTDAERDDLAVAYLELLRRLDLFFEGPGGAPVPLPYIAAWHQAPVREGRELSRLHLQVFSVLRAPGKLKYLAGSESGMGAWVSDTTPERIAARLQALAPAPAAQWVESWPDDVGADRVRQAFAAAYPTDGTEGGDEADVAPEVRVYAAPGRVNIIGEHTDYNAGLCLPIALPHRTYVALRPRTDSVVRLASAQEPGAAWTGRLEDVAPGAVTGWAAYVAGVAWALGQHLEATGGSAETIRGFDAVVDSCVPYGAGLSSSAALECSVAVGIDDVAGLGLAATDAGRATLAAAAIRAENEVAGAPTGGMDQSASLRCAPGHALLLDCRPGLDPARAVEQIPFDLAAEGLALLVIDTRAEHALVDGQYAQRRATCEAAAATLGLANLRELADSVIAAAAGTPRGEAAFAEALGEALDRLPDDVSRRRVRHVVTEIARTQDLVSLLRAGRASDVGPLMDASHASLRDDYEVSATELDVAVEAARHAGALGARMTGGGFGGSAIALVPADRADAVAEAVAAAFARAGLGAPGFLLAVPSAPAGAC